MAVNQRRLERSSLGSQVAEQLRNDIVFGRLPAGAAVSQQQLCEDYGTSRMPVRDAIRQLQYEGLIVNTDGGHHVVAEQTAQDMSDAYRVEAMVHGLAARRATELASDQDLDQLEQLHHAMVKAVDEDDLEAVVELNWRFHRQINQMAKSAKLMAIIRAVSLSIPRGYLLELPGWASRANLDHEKIIEAMRARDVDRVIELIDSHIEEAGQNLIRYLETRSQPAEIEPRP